jgi:type VI secretion system lysozyme-like protein
VAALHLVQGARAPLFDRFGAVGEGAAAPLLEWHDARRAGQDVEASALELSIGRELGRLLNTRCGATLAQLAGRERSVIDYGLPDYSTLYTDHIDDRRRLTELVRDTIAAFEPRLREVEVRIELLGNSRHALRVYVQGMVAVHGQLEPVSLQVGANLEGKGA